MEEIDIWRSANILLQQHGPDAYAVAIKRAIDLMDRDDQEGAEAWRRIILAIDGIVRGKPLPDEQSH